MENNPAKRQRVAYSFRAGTIDLREWCPGLWFEGDDGRAVAVQLDGEWDKIFSRMAELRTVLATVRSGAVYAADTWWEPDFQSLPGTHTWFDISTGTEIRSTAIGSAMAVVEHFGNQQIASLQFCDRQGQGSLKIMMTEGSDLQAFEDLVISRAAASSSSNSDRCETSANSSKSGLLPETGTVHSLWNGLQRCTPGRWFPGIPGVRRLDALKAAGFSHARPVKTQTLSQVMETMTQSGAAVMTRIHSASALMPLQLKLTHWKDCHCGRTFFSSSSQLTLRTDSALEAWAIQLTGQHVALEVYDNRGQFAASFVLDSKATAEHRHLWQESLQFSC